jgi:hypothetical protein
LKVEGGQLKDVQLRLSYRRIDGDRNRYDGSVEIDARGRFLIEKLVAGDYELIVGPMGVMVTGDAGGETQNRLPTVKQTVNVRPETESNVTLVLSLRP